MSVDLAALNSFRVEASASALRKIEYPEQLPTLTFDPERDLILGGGSNVLLAGDVPGTVLLNRMTGRKVHARSDEHTVLDIGAGEPWHELVLWSLEQGLSGLENLALIPGLAGAAPMQNIGAYGVEVGEYLLAVQVWDWQKKTLAWLDRDDCELGYRSSRFKHADAHRYLITALRLQLNNRFNPRLEYAGLEGALQTRGATEPTAREVCDAVVRLRMGKLPDPAVLGNAGSFFQNPEIDAADADRLRRDHPDLPLFPSRDDRYKASAGWLIEACGWKGFREGDAGVSAQHALVLVNHGHASGADLLTLAERIAQSVKQQFDVQLVPEPRIISLGMAATGKPETGFATRS